MGETHYSADVRCQNCKKWTWLKIPYGMSIEEFGREENKVCGSCGCMVIKVKEIKEDKKEDKPSKPVEVDPDNSNLK